MRGRAPRPPRLGDGVPAEYAGRNAIGSGSVGTAEREDQERDHLIPTVAVAGLGTSPASATDWTSRASLLDTSPGGADRARDACRHRDPGLRARRAGGRSSAAALVAAPIWVLSLAALLHLTSLITRSEAWNGCVRRGGRERFPGAWSSVRRASARWPASSAPRSGWPHESAPLRRTAPRDVPKRARADGRRGSDHCGRGHPRRSLHVHPGGSTGPAGPGSGAGAGRHAGRRGRPGRPRPPAAARDVAGAGRTARPARSRAARRAGDHRRGRADRAQLAGSPRGGRRRVGPRRDCRPDRDRQPQPAADRSECRRRRIRAHPRQPRGRGDGRRRAAADRDRDRGRAVLRRMGGRRSVAGQRSPPRPASPGTRGDPRRQGRDRASRGGRQRAALIPERPLPRERVSRPCECPATRRGSRAARRPRRSAARPGRPG